MNVQISDFIWLLIGRKMYKSKNKCISYALYQLQKNWIVERKKKQKQQQQHMYDIVSSQIRQQHIFIRKYRELLPSSDFPTLKEFCNQSNLCHSTERKWKVCILLIIIIKWFNWQFVFHKRFFHNLASWLLPQWYAFHVFNVNINIHLVLVGPLDFDVWILTCRDIVSPVGT